ncbi:DNA methyltransferase [Enorma sp.]|uniref:site-specific DNA-methyltransferase n=1 Tax=Enorma sp. TaxID=1920692 RepID=UPI0025C1E325|nr:DNA methyltransferase [Enorma sp.]
MARTAQAQVQDMIERASRLGDDVLASEIRAFAASRQFGLVFEHNRPERMRLYGKPVSVEDVVQVLPERGKMEDAASKLLWRVDNIQGETASLIAYRSSSYTDNEGEPRDASLEDLVAVAEYDQPIYAGLRETGRVERGGDKPYQVVINGENYHALESLLFCYAGKVDCIYIDPPYNSGARDWKYNNDYVDGTDEYRHSKWLAMMERRLKLAKRLLNPSNSVLICTIDEYEYLSLGLLLNQTFPGCKIQMITSVTNPSGRSRGKSAGNFSVVGEYIYFVRLGCCSVKPWTYSMLPIIQDNGNMRKKNPRIKGGLKWESFLRSGQGNTRSARKNLFYPILIDKNQLRIVSVGEPWTDESLPKEIDGYAVAWPIKKDGTLAIWHLEGSSLRRCLDKGYAYVSSYDSKRDTFAIKYLTQGVIDSIESGEVSVSRIGKRGQVVASDSAIVEELPKSVWNMRSHNAGKSGTDMVLSMLGGRQFPFPKSLYAVEDTVRFFVADKPGALVLDFFSGSGTTAHAVMRLNHQDGGRRRCICVTNNEVSEAEEKKLTKQGCRHGDPEWERLGICEYITKPRIEAAITGRTPDGEPIKGDYKFTDEFPMADGFEENAVFFDLTYQNPDAVELGAAFEEIAPLLWLRAGARGRIIEHEEPGFAVADAYAILFDYSYVREFVKAVHSARGLSCAFIVTDDAGRFASAKEELGGIECVRLYESYLRSFKIAAEDAVR